MGQARKDKPKISSRESILIEQQEELARRNAWREPVRGTVVR
jgi:hypothetical protein